MLVDVEFQPELDVDIHERLGEYGFGLRREIRYGRGQAGKYDVGFVLVNLTGAAQAAQRDMRCAELDGSGLLVKVKVITMRDEDAAETLDRIAAEPSYRCLLPWIPLMRGGDDAAIIERWKELAQQESNSQLRSDYGSLALVFSELSGRFGLWKQALESWNVQQSPQVLEWQREAREKGREEGREKGSLETRREDIQQVLKSRFGQAIPESLQRAIGGLEDTAALKRLLDAALSASSLEDFQKSLDEI